jgi:hypothetical protein
MPPSPPPGLPARSSAVVNEEIRRLIAAARGRSLGASERDVYEALLAEWTRARQVEEARGRYVRAA